MIKIWKNDIQMVPVFLKKINGKYAIELYSTEASIIKEINGKYITESYASNGRVYEGNQW